jgi:hypothetical protein
MNTDERQLSLLFLGIGSVPEIILEQGLDSLACHVPSAPVGSAGTVDVPVIGPGRTSGTSSADQFTSVAPPPP